MNKTILEQALDHLLNKEEGKASALLHDYYVGVGRKVYEDIMADSFAFEDEDEDEDQFSPAHSVKDSMHDVESDLTEEGDEMDMEDQFGKEEDAEEDLDTDLGDEEAAPVDASASEVADAMMDVESALAKLKAEFEQMVSGASGEEEMSEEPGEEETEEMPESIEEALELQRVAKPSNTEGQAAGAGTGANSVTGATNTASPVAKRNPMMARPATNFAGDAAQGVPSGTTPAKAPASKDLGYTTKPAVSKVSKPGTAPGREAGSSPSDLPRG